MIRQPSAFLFYLGVLALAGAATVYLAASKMGPGVSTDGAVMLSAADNLARGRGLLNYSGVPLTQFAPLYSGLVALGSLVFHADVFLVAWVLSGATFGLTIWFSGLYCWQVFAEEPLLAYFASFIVCSSVSLIQIFANVASDPLFLLLVVLYLTSMTAYLRSGKLATLFVTGGLVILACFLRYAGLALVIAGALVLAVYKRSQPRKALLYSAAFGIATGLPILLWGYLRNLPVSGYAFGARQVSIPTINFTTGVEKLLYWFIPFRIIARVGALPLFLVLLAGLVLIALATKPQNLLRRLLQPGVLPSALFVAVYSGVLIFNISTPELKGINTDRVHIIMLPSLLIVLFKGLAHLMEEARRRIGSRWMYAALLMLFLAWTSYPLSRSHEYVRASMSEGDVSSYNSINDGNVRESPLARYLASLDLAHRQLYSNGGDSAWLLTHELIAPMPMLPSDDRLATLKQEYGNWPGAGQQGYLVWFYGEAYKTAYARPEELSKIAHLEQVYADERAVVYLVTPR